MSIEHPEQDPSQDSPQSPEAGTSTDAFFATSDAQIDLLKQELIDAEKRVLLAQADLENFRKRMRREREEELKYANVPLLTELLPVVDNLQRGIESAEKSEQTSALLDGIKMVEKHLLETMKKRGCEPIAALGEAFDPNLHEAIMQQPSADVAPGTVLLVAQVGYKMYDRVIRPAQVIVSKAPE